MNFLAPLGLLFGLFLPAVIVLYLLKLKRVDQVISSTLLWRQSVEDLKANTPFQKLKRNLLLYLQLLIIALLTLAAARPVLELGGLRGQSFVVLIDQSASMNAGDVEPTRLEAAKQLALELIDDMSMGDRMMVAAFSNGARVLTPFETNKSVLRQIVSGIEATDNPTDIDEALRVARSAGELQTNAEVVIVSDGGFDPPDSEELAGLRVRYAPVGVTAENVGIVDLTVRRDYSLDQTHQLLVGVENAGNEARDLFVELYGSGGLPGEEAEQSDEDEEILLDARQIALDAGQRDTLLFTDPGNFTRTLRVRLDSGDDFTVDDEAWAVIHAEAHIDVLIVSANNPYLERVLNVDARTRVAAISPGDYVGSEGYDLVVFDAWAPAAIGAGSYLFINAVPPLPGWTMGDEIELPFIISYDRFHPLSRYVNFDTLVINRCRNMGMPGWAETVVESRETALLASFETDDIRGVVTAFDIYDSNWPRRVSFPVFFMNLIDWAAAGQSEASIRSTGDVLTLAPPDSLSRQAALVLPPPLDRREIIFDAPDPMYFGETDRQGVYEYLIEDQVRSRYAVNLASSDESRIAPRPELQFGAVEVEGEAGGIISNQEIWRTLALVALLVLMFEWWVYVKRARYSF